jgi:hypothetical protein
MGAASERTKQMHKTIALSDAVEKIPDGASVIIGGFLGVGSPHSFLSVRADLTSEADFTKDHGDEGQNR